MRTEYDEDRDLLIVTVSDKPSVRTEEHSSGGVRRVVHFAEDGTPVRMEVHGASKERAACGTKTSVDFEANPLDRTVIGNVRWRFTSGDRQKVLDEGTTPMHLGDTKIREIHADGAVQHRRVLPLSDELAFGLSSRSAQARECPGFAFTGFVKGEQTFGWDWFHVQEPGKGLKIQEPGEVLFELLEHEGEWQISRTVFTTDVSLRILGFPGTPPSDPGWRIEILQGSVVDWPRLINGEIVGSG